MSLSMSLGAHLAHRREEAQPQVLAGHLGQEVGIERGVRRHELPDQHLLAIEQRDVAWLQGRLRHSGPAA